MAASRAPPTARRNPPDMLAVLKAQEVLARYTELLYRDFDFEDVRYDVWPYVLTTAECDDILGRASSTSTSRPGGATQIEQIDRLVFVLGASAPKLYAFINAVAQKYDWLAKWMRMALLDETSGVRLEAISEQIRKLRNEIPRLEALNVSRMSYLFRIQQVLRKLSPGECLMLTGDLVYGKKWLAIDACCNYPIMDQMDGRIYLVTLDKCQSDEDILERMVYLYSLLNPTAAAAQPTVYADSTSLKIHVLKSLLIRELATQPDSLLVLCDVQCTRVLQSFTLQCKCMLTTRNKAILDTWPQKMRHVITIANGFTAAESLALFARVLDIEVHQLPKEAHEIHSRCDGSPFIISTVACDLRDCRMTKQRWSAWVSKLNTNESTRHDPLRRIIEQSMSDLPDGYAQLFYSLAIFGDNVKIPLSLLQAYWAKKRPDVEEIVQKLDQLYLVERIVGQCDATNEQEFCLLKYHYYSFLSHYHTDAVKQLLHLKLIQSYDIPPTIDADFADPDVCHRLNDRYFYFYIGQHLRHSGRVDFFRPLYLNLSFLEQKLRLTGLPNTIGNLATFRREITGKAPGRVALLNQLLEFLPNVEEMLIKSADTTLLQYALNTGGALRAEARRQADAQPHRVLFVGSDHVNRHRRQIIALPQRPTYTRFCDPDTALFAFDNHHIYLADLSSEFNIQPSLFVGHKAAIVDIKLLSTVSSDVFDDYGGDGDDGNDGGGGPEFVSLDLDGVCHVWSLESTPIHRRRTSSSSTQPTNVRQSRTDSFNRHTNTHTFKQTIEARPRSKDRIRCMALVHRTNSSSVVSKVIFGTTDGKLLVYDRIRNGLQRDIELKTNMRDIRAIQTTASRALIILTGNGSLWLYDTKTTSSHRLGALTLDDADTKVIAMHSLSGASHTTGADHLVAVVFSGQILRVHISGLDGAMPAIEGTLLYEAMASDHNRISFSVLTDDRRYLVLGTERGIVVLDVRTSGDDADEIADAAMAASNVPPTTAAMLYGRVSDRIACVDVHSLDGERFKYLLVCGTNASVGQQLCYLYALEANGGALTELLPQLDAWLLGGQQFGVMHTDDSAAPATARGWRLLAVDSLGRLQCRGSADGFVAATPYVVDGLGPDNAVLRLCCCGDYVVLGCADGTIRDNRQGVLMRLGDGEVTFLQCIGDRIVVAGTPISYRISTHALEITSTQVRRCFAVADGESWLVIVKESAGFDVYDMRHQQFVSCSDQQTPGRQLKLGDCDLVGDCLAIATTGELHVWRFAIDAATGGPVGLRRRQTMFAALNDGHSTATSQAVCLKLSADRGFVAIGFQSGLIQLYRLGAHRTQFVHELRSHRTAVRALLFAPWPLSGGQPLVLASMAAELCFWDVTEADNNPTLDGGGHVRRRSMRFHERTTAAVTPQTPDDDDLDGTLLRQVPGPWSGKAGDRRKPTLLACIKFVGGMAEQLFANAAFTQFLTIDDSGEIYHFTLRQASDKSAATSQPSLPPSRGPITERTAPLNGHYS